MYARCKGRLLLRQSSSHKRLLSFTPNFRQVRHRFVDLIKLWLLMWASSGVWLEVSSRCWPIEFNRVSAAVLSLVSLVSFEKVEHQTDSTVVVTLLQFLFELPFGFIGTYIWLGALKYLLLCQFDAFEDKYVKAKLVHETLPPMLVEFLKHLPFDEYLHNGYSRRLLWFITQVFSQSLKEGRNLLWNDILLEFSACTRSCWPECREQLLLLISQQYFCQSFSLGSNHGFADPSALSWS